MVQSEVMIALLLLHHNIHGRSLDEVALIQSAVQQPVDLSVRQLAAHEHLADYLHQSPGHPQRSRHFDVVGDEHLLIEALGIHGPILVSANIAIIVNTPVRLVSVVVVMVDTGPRTLSAFAKIRQLAHFEYTALCETAQ